MGASGAVEAIITIKSIEENIITPIINYKEKDEECNLNLVTEKSINTKVDYALSNSFGFGGHNVSLIFKKWSK